MSLRYSAFGLSLGADRPIPGLVPQTAERSADAQIWLNRELPSLDQRNRPGELWYVTPRESDADPPPLRAWRLADGAYFRLRYDDGTEFLVDGAGASVWGSWQAPLTLQDAATYLLGPVIGFVLRLRGITCLHASAVTIDGRAIALVGPASSGKSTTAAVFAHLGFPAMADDIVALSEGEDVLQVRPAYPQLRLWPDSVALLFGTADALPRLTPNWDKRALALSGAAGGFEPRPQPLAAIYQLAARGPDTARVMIEDVPPTQALLTLVGNSYVGYLLDGSMRAREFTTLARVVTEVPMRRVTAPDDPTRVAELCHAIVADLETLRVNPQIPKSLNS